MAEPKFNPSKVQCVSNTMFVEVFVENTVNIELASGEIKKLTKLNEAPEPYALVHSVGNEVKTMEPGQYVLLKPMKSGIFKIEDRNYCFIAAYNVDAILPQEYLNYFSSKAQADANPSSNLTP